MTGDAEVMAAPDIAYVSLGARTRANTAGEASTENASVMTQVMNALRAAGISKADIETVQYTVQPAYEYPNGQQRLVGYDATNIVKVTVRDLARVGKVIDAASTAGANVVQDVRFSVKDESAFRAKALAQAAAEAKSKASTVANAMGVKVGRLQNVTEGVAPVVVPYVMAMGAAQAKVAETPISPQQITVRASVTATYAIQ